MPTQCLWDLQCLHTEAYVQEKEGQAEKHRRPEALAHGECVTANAIQDAAGAALMRRANALAVSRATSRHIFERS